MNYISKKNYIKVTNDGWFLARVYVTFVNENGYSYYKSDLIPIGETWTININYRVKKVYLKVQMWVLGVIVHLFEDWVSTKTSNCYILTGTIFNPNITKVPCPRNKNIYTMNKYYNSCNCYNYYTNNSCDSYKC